MSGGAMQSLLPILGGTGGAAAGSMLGPYGSMAGMGLGAAGGSALGGLGGGPAGGGPGPLSGTANMMNRVTSPMGMSGSPVDPQSQAAPAAGGQTQPMMMAPPAENPNAAAWAGVGPVGQAYFDYLLQRKAIQQQQRTDFIPAHSTPMTSGLPQLSLYPTESFALPQIG